MTNHSTVQKITGFVLACGFMATVHAQQIVYITGTNKIGVITDSGTPSLITGPFNITGLPAGQVIEGIDYRPLTGELFALGYDASSQEAQLYIINQTSASATPVGVPNALDLVPGKIGFDFNPTVDRIRLTSGNGANYRLHPATGAVVATDGNLTFADTDVNAGLTPDIVASAYTRSYIGSETTTLYNIDFGLNILTTQVPSNSGTLNTVGSLNLAFHVPDATVGFDFFYDGAADEEKAYLAANTNNASDSLYTINVSTGAVTNLGQIGNGLDVRDIAVVIKRTIPALQGVEAFALTGLGNLISFDTENPGIIRSWKPISGVTSGQTLLGVDFRPATGELYALGYDFPFSQYQLYTVDINTGAAIAINATPIGIGLDTAIVGFDFNPVADRIRVIGAGGENYRINPDNGALVGVDADVKFASGDINFGQTPFITTVAYLNSYPGALETTLLAYDGHLNAFGNLSSPNNGEISTLANSGLIAGGAALDTYFNLPVDANEIFCASNNESSLFDIFYKVENNIFNEVGGIGFGIPIRSIALPIGEAPGNLGVAESAAHPSVSIYPNPAVDFIRIETDGHLSGQTFRVVDMAGRVVIFGKINTQDVETIQVSSWDAGIYFVVFEDGTSVKWVKG